MARVFHESDLRISFSDGWTVLKFDTHRYFKAISGHGYKGVDFIGYHPTHGVLLLEIKNYTLRYGDALVPKTKAFLENPETLVPLLDGKFRDSQTMITTIHGYLRRRWWYRLLLRFPRLLPLFALTNKELPFWYQVTETAASNITLATGLAIAPDFAEAFAKSVDQPHGLHYQLSERFSKASVVFIFADQEGKELRVEGCPPLTSVRPK